AGGGERENPMAQRPLTPEGLEAAFAELVDAAERRRREMLRESAEATRQEAEVLQAGRDELWAAPGPRPPPRPPLGAAVPGAKAMVALAGEAAERAERHRDGKRDDWIVLGRVLDRDGSPAPRLRVKIADREGRFAGLLRETATDAAGEFFQAYHPDELGEL